MGNLQGYVITDDMLLSIVLLACGNPACPTDRAITAEDLACDCGIQVVEELQCEELYCTEDDVLLGAGSCS